MLHTIVGCVNTLVRQTLWSRLHNTPYSIVSHYTSHKAAQALQLLMQS